MTRLAGFGVSGVDTPLSLPLLPPGGLLRDRYGGGPSVIRVLPLAAQNKNTVTQAKTKNHEEPTNGKNQAELSLIMPDRNKNARAARVRTIDQPQLITGEIQRLRCCLRGTTSNGMLINAYSSQQTKLRITHLNRTCYTGKGNGN